MVLWSPILANDSKSAAVRASAYLSNEKSKHYWDLWKFALNHYTKEFEYPADKTAWDIFVVYKPGQKWGEAPATWMQNHKLDLGIQYTQDLLLEALLKVAGS